MTVSAETRADRLYNAVCAALALINAGYTAQAGTVLVEAKRQDNADSRPAKSPEED